MSYRELEQLMNNYSKEQSENISLAEAYNIFVGNEDEKKEDKADTKSSK